MTDPTIRLLADIQALAPGIAARADETEAARCIPADLMDALRSIGVFRLFVPKSVGGLELDLPAALQVVSALARIDGSVGWTAMIIGGNHLFASRLPPNIYEQVYRNGPDVVLAGAILAAGTAVPAENGWQVSGRWPSASACLHADWMFGGCIVSGRGSDGPARTRCCILPARDWQIEDTWHVAGLKGTGSHHISICDITVPEDALFDPMAAAPHQAGPLYQALLPVLPMLLASSAVGMAQGTLDDLVGLARAGRKQLSAAAPMRDSEIFQSELGRIAAEVRAARALLEVQATEYWRRTLAQALDAEAAYVEATQASIWIYRTCVGVADACFSLGGGSAIYDSSPLQRRLRDLHTGAQHMRAQPRHYVAAGRLLLHAPDPAA